MIIITIHALPSNHMKVHRFRFHITYCHIRCLLNLLDCVDPIRTEHRMLPEPYQCFSIFTHTHTSSLYRFHFHPDSFSRSRTLNEWNENDDTIHTRTLRPNLMKMRKQKKTNTTSHHHHRDMVQQHAKRIPNHNNQHGKNKIRINSKQRNCYRFEGDQISPSQFTVYKIYEQRIVVRTLNFRQQQIFVQIKMHCVFAR